MKRIVRAIVGPILLMFLGVLLIVAAMTPILPRHSDELAAAYSRYLRNPTEEARNEWQTTADRINRPLHIAQYSVGIAGIASLLVGVSKMLCDKRPDASGPDVKTV